VIHDLLPVAYRLPTADEGEVRTLLRTWREPAGLRGHLLSVDHKRIGLRFIITAFCFFVLAGLLAALMRLQLARPETHLLGPDLYNQIFTMHGTTMMFLFAVPAVLGFGVYLVPLMVGARSIAFPRLLAFSYWMFLFSGIFLYTMFLLNTGPDNGWFSYVPLAGPEYGLGKRADVWAQLVTFTETSGLGVAVCLVVTIFKLRAPGMALNRIPLFVWAELVTAFMTIFSMPSVFLASGTLIMDRLVGTHFYNQAEGGDPLLWQHLFWFFAHPEVYIIFLPGAGMVSMIVATFSRRAAFGYTTLVLSLVATAFIGFGVWVHHMFATGLPQFGTSFFTAASLMIVLPTAAQVYCWIATMWSGRVWLATPMLYALGFFQVFILGGLTGVMLAAVPLNIQVHDTFFVVAHFHYVLIGGSLFPMLGGLVYWFPKMTGRMLSERLGLVAFALVVVGFNVTFFPQHILGLMGMPRRVYTYPAVMQWGSLNMLSTIGAGLLAIGLSVYLANIIISLRRGAVAPDNPWQASSLEWATSSPPPPHNFAPLPTVASRDPLWDTDRDAQPIIVGIRANCREVLVTHVLDAEPDHRNEFPDPTPWPFITAVATSGLYIGSIFTPWAVVWGAIPVAIGLLGWAWPREGRAPEAVADEIARMGATEARHA
jgi:cytochrome c oxidase subunit I+III